MLSWLKKKLHPPTPKQAEQISAYGSELLPQEADDTMLRNEMITPVENITGTSEQVKSKFATIDSERPFSAKASPAKPIILEHYTCPSAALLNEPISEVDIDPVELEQNKARLAHTLYTFGAGIQSITATVGPTETLYEVVPSNGVRIAKIVNLKEDIALTLNAPGISIIAPMPGRGTVGISIPNSVRQTVFLRPLLESAQFCSTSMSLPVAVGKGQNNADYIMDLAVLPHLLLAGTTGQGKSVGIHAIILSLLCKKHPSELKFVMIDTKQVELIGYEAIAKHFLAKLPSETYAVVTEVHTAIKTLNALCKEMDNRYELLKNAGVRQLKDYNKKISDHLSRADRGYKNLPFIVLVIDEFADLVTRAGREAETPLTRLAQTGRAVGIHMIAATQHPSAEVITSNIKANFLGRIAFKVTSKNNSRTIIDVNGAEALLGNGDMLVSINNELKRAQCAFVTTAEMERVVNFIATQQAYPTPYLLPEDSSNKEGNDFVDLTKKDDLFDDCARVVVQMQSGSTSNLQRRLNLGYNRAGRIMDQLEAAGVVGPANGSKPREVYFKTEAELNQFLLSLR